jgi:hypothetical protein
LNTLRSFRPAAGWSSCLTQRVSASEQLALAPSGVFDRFLTYFHEARQGGRFVGCEEPELFATEIRAAFKSVRVRSRWYRFWVSPCRSIGHAHWLAVA